MPTHHDGPARERRALDAFIKLARATGTVEARLAAHLKGEGLTQPQLAVLEALHHLGPLSQTELGAKMLRTGGSVTSLVDHLERKGLVERRRGEPDRRVCRLHLTAVGRRTIRRVFPRHAAAVADAFSGLSAAEQEELGRLCRKLGLDLAGRE